MKSNMQKWEELLNDGPESYKEWFKKEKKYLHNAQLKAFMDILFRSNIPPYHMKQVEVVREKIKKRAN